jgi:3-methyladenine DNA glycosylase AlkC
MVKIMNKIHLMVDKTLHRKLKVQHELNKTEGENQKVSHTIFVVHYNITRYIIYVLHKNKEGYGD